MPCCHRNEPECDLQIVNIAGEEVETSYEAIMREASLADGEPRVVTATDGTGREVSLTQEADGGWCVETNTSESYRESGVKAFVEFLSRIEDMGYYLDVADYPNPA